MSHNIPTQNMDEDKHFQNTMKQGVVLAQLIVDIRELVAVHGVLFSQ